ncbi:mucin-7-like [Zingiber officinale]|uniref:mucin-7-like n=1 Tax=Zingiber officinale TaxID=94328 RepID=UPI001C4DB5DA|nr:mucin-7-like [Zingiber officinale]
MAGQVKLLHLLPLLRFTAFPPFISSSSSFPSLFLAVVLSPPLSTMPSSNPATTLLPFSTTRRDTALANRTPWPAMPRHGLCTSSPPFSLSSASIPPTTATSSCNSRTLSPPPEEAAAPLPRSPPGAPPTTTPASPSGLRPPGPASSATTTRTCRRS